MFTATDDAGDPVKATRDGRRRAKCPHPDCGELVIAKTGDQLRWHWAHDSGRTDCPTTAYAPMTPWHYDWQGLFPGWQEHYERNDATGEVRRADVYIPAGVAVEFQHSSLAAAEILGRERFWTRGDRWLIWVLDGSQRSDTWKYGVGSDRVIVLVERAGMVKIGQVQTSRLGVAGWLSAHEPRDLLRARDAARQALAADYARREDELADREAGLAAECARREDELADREAGLAGERARLDADRAQLDAGWALAREAGVTDAATWADWRGRTVALANASKAEAERAHWAARAAEAESARFAAELIEAAGTRTAELDARAAALDAIDPAERDAIRAEVAELRAWRDKAYTDPEYEAATRESELHQLLRDRVTKNNAAGRRKMLRDHGLTPEQAVRVFDAAAAELEAVRAEGGS